MPYTQEKTMHSSCVIINKNIFLNKKKSIYIYITILFFSGECALARMKCALVRIRVSLHP